MRFFSLFLHIIWQIREFSAPDATVVTSEHKLRCWTHRRETSISEDVENYWYQIFLHLVN